MAVLEIHGNREPRAKIPFGATRVLKACAHPLLTWTVKAVWLELYALHSGPDGAYIGATPLAQRLGLSRESVERSRRTLKELGLLWDLKRDGKRTGSWFPTLPEACFPSSERPKDTEILPLASRLAELLEQRATGHASDAGRGSLTACQTGHAGDAGRNSTGHAGDAGCHPPTGSAPDAGREPTGVTDTTHPDPTGHAHDAGLGPTGVTGDTTEVIPTSQSVVRKNIQPQEVGGSVEPTRRLDQLRALYDTAARAPTAKEPARV